MAAYAAAWSEPDRAKRDASLAIAWSEDGIYRDPLKEAKGRHALSDYIGTVHQKTPGARIEYTSGVNQHHDHIYFSWHLVTDAGEPVLVGVDFGTLDGDGRLLQIVGFFGEMTSL